MRTIEEDRIATMATVMANRTCRLSEATCNNNRPTHGALKLMRRLHLTCSIDLWTRRAPGHDACPLSFSLSLSRLVMTSDAYACDIDCANRLRETCLCIVE